MIGRFAVLASRIRHDLVEIDRVVQRVAKRDLSAFAGFLENVAQDD